MLTDWVPTLSSSDALLRAPRQRVPRLDRQRRLDHETAHKGRVSLAERFSVDKKGDTGRQGCMANCQT